MVSICQSKKFRLKSLNEKLVVWTYGFRPNLMSAASTRKWQKVSNLSLQYAYAVLKIILHLTFESEIYVILGGK